MGKGRDPCLAGGEELLHRELGARMQVHPPRRAIVADGIGGEGVKMHLVAGADG